MDGSPSSPGTGTAGAGASTTSRIRTEKALVAFIDIPAMVKARRQVAYVASDVLAAWKRHGGEPKTFRKQAPVQKVLVHMVTLLRAEAARVQRAGKKLRSLQKLLDFVQDQLQHEHSPWVTLCWSWAQSAEKSEHQSQQRVAHRHAGQGSASKGSHSVDGGNSDSSHVQQNEGDTRSVRQMNLGLLLRLVEAIAHPENIDALQTDPYASAEPGR